jgi:hypothetical protein
MESRLAAGGYAKRETRTVRVADKNDHIRVALDRANCYRLVLRGLAKVAGQLTVFYDDREAQPRVTFEKADANAIQREPYCAVKTAKVELLLSASLEITGESTLELWSRPSPPDEMKEVERAYLEEVGRNQGYINAGNGDGDPCGACRRDHDNCIGGARRPFRSCARDFADCADQVEEAHFGKVKCR